MTPGFLTLNRRRLAYALLALIAGGVVWQSAVLSRAQKAANDMEVMFDLAQRGSQSGLWYWCPSKPGTTLQEQADDFVWYSPVFRAMLGYADTDFPPKMSSFLNCVHPDDRASLDVAVVNALSAGGKIPFLTECRLRHADGSYHWYSAKGAVNLGDHGEIIQMAGSIWPEAGTRAERQLLYGLFDVAPIALVVCDEVRNIIIFNTAAETLTGYTRREVIGKKAEDMLFGDKAAHDKHITAYTKTARELSLDPVTGPIIRPHVPGKLRRADGKTIDVEVALRSIRYDDRLAFLAYIRGK